MHTTYRDELIATSESKRPWLASIAAFVLASVLVVIPCWWHSHFEAGDLGSHVYNAWLATLIEKGQAPGLYLTHSWTNFLFDDLLIWSGKAFGFHAGEKITICVIVLIFFWGAFAFISAITERAAWVITPALAMLSYGFTLNSGFCNCYLSVGLVFFALALIWRNPTPLKWLAALGFLLLGFAAHPFGLVVAIGIGVYAKLANWFRDIPRARWALFGSAFVLIVAVHFVLKRFSPTYFNRRMFFLYNGGDQLYYFGHRYMLLGQLVILFGAIVFFTGFLPSRRSRREGEAAYRVPLELWIALMACTLAIPQVITLPQYATIFGPIISRITLITAVLAFAIVATVQPRVWHFAGYAVLAVFFFSFYYHDTGLLSKMGDDAERLTSTLPYGTRVVGTLGGQRGWRTVFMHVIDAECVGHCFFYDDYEPPSLQFRIRVKPDCRIAAPTNREAVLLQYGAYRVTAAELPLKEIYQCTISDITHLCMRDLSANEPNCPGCNYAFYPGPPPAP